MGHERESSPDHAPESAQPSRSPDDGVSRASQPFRWPPRAADTPSAAAPGPAAWAADSDAPGRPSRARLAGPALPPSEARRSLISTIEHTWLGVVRASWHERALAAGWHPDDPALWCGRCGQAVGDLDASDEGCSLCRGIALPWARVVRLGAYEGVLRDAILEVKHTAWAALGRDLGRTLGRSLRAALLERGADMSRVVVCPVPTSFWRRLGRGIDHTRALAEGVHGELAGAHYARVLTRAHRPMQTGTSLVRRRKNVHASMRPRRLGAIDLLSMDVVIVIDDVMTSGATMREAVRAARTGMSGAAREPEWWVGVAAVTAAKSGTT